MLHKQSYAQKVLKMPFLVACTQLYTWLCPSIRWSVGQLVIKLVHHTFTFFINFLSLSHFKSFKRILTAIIAVKPCPFWAAAQQKEKA